MSVLRMSLLSFKNLFSRPVTRRFPKVKREPFAASRGEIKIQIDKCIFCGLCARKCPGRALVVNKEEKSWEIDPLACVVCGYCVDVCPKKCLSQKRVAHAPVAERVRYKSVQQAKPDAAGH